MASALEILTLANQLAIPVARAHLTSNQNVPAVSSTGTGQMTQLTTNAIDFDPFSGFNTSTGTFTCPCPGLWLAYAQAKWATTTTSTWLHIGIAHNNITTAVGPDISTSSSLVLGAYAFDVISAAAGDTIYCGANWGASVGTNLSTNAGNTTGRDDFFIVGLLART